MVQTQLFVLKEFYGVTKAGSVYLAKIGRSEENELVPKLFKIAKSGQMFEKPEFDFFAPMLAIAKDFILFVPEGCGTTSYQREVMMVNRFYWSYQTNNIVALFLAHSDAVACSASSDLKPCDSRWLGSTIEVLKAVGDKHPNCSISNAPDFWLIPPEQWRT